MRLSYIMPVFICVSIGSSAWAHAQDGNSRNLDTMASGQATRSPAKAKSDIESNDKITQSNKKKDALENKKSD